MKYTLITTDDGRTGYGRAPDIARTFLVIDPNGHAATVRIEDPEDVYKGLKTLTLGRLAALPPNRLDVMAYVDDEAVVMGMLYNQVGSILLGLPIHGPVVIGGPLIGDEDYGIPPELVDRLRGDCLDIDDDDYEPEVIVARWGLPPYALRDLDAMHAGGES